MAIVCVPLNLIGAGTGVAVPVVNAVKADAELCGRMLAMDPHVIDFYFTRYKYF